VPTLDDQRETTGEIVARTAIQPHARAVLPGDNPNTIVLDLMQPLAAGRQFIGFGYGAMNPAGRVRCNMRTK
jgi:hypothetical protein